MWQYKTDSSDRSAFPMGLTRIEGGIHISVAAAADTCELLLFPPQSRLDQAIRIPFPPSGRTGDVWEMDLAGENLDTYTYAFAADGYIFADPFGPQFAGREVWGDPAQVHALMTSPVREEPFDWGDDRPLKIPYEESIVYRIHVRGFTRHASSRVQGPGTFRGVAEMIPYLKDLGITTLELMPVSEFQEVMVTERPEGAPYGEEAPSGRLNYWGYTGSFLRAPKASYAGPGTSPGLEFKKLVRALHQAGIEVVVELYLDGRDTWPDVLDTARHWVRQYHVDGIHFTGQPVPGWLLAGDPYLADTKLWAAYWEEVPGPAARSGGRPRWAPAVPPQSSPPSGSAAGLQGSPQSCPAIRPQSSPPSGSAVCPQDSPQTGSPRPARLLADYNDGFLISIRRAVKGDEGQMRPLVDSLCRNPGDRGVINYLATNNGFTLADLVAYEQKHNEANGENNRDGSDSNYSWNCGVEGPTRKKKILDLRKRQVRNALLLLFLSQGTPLLMAGDEFGNSQNGNNNAYCQDNDISWLNWRQTKTGQKLLEFVKYVIAFRKAHPVFHMARAPRLMDYLSCGHPDVSFHGLNTWYPEFEDFRRQIGVMYCGAYGKKADGTPDDYFYLACNFHWEPHEFALPNLPKGLSWHMAFDTGSLAVNGYYLPGEEPVLDNQKRYMVPARTVLVLIGRRPQEEADTR